MSQEGILHTMFHIGRILATSAVLVAIVAVGQHPTNFLDRHMRGVRGSLDDEDRRLLMTYRLRPPEPV